MPNILIRDLSQDAIDRIVQSIVQDTPVRH